MNYLKITLFFIAGLLTFQVHAQSNKDKVQPKNSFIIKIDSLEIDIYNNYESDAPPLSLNNLQKPTLFILNDEELEISEFSELVLEEGKAESLTIIQNQDEIKKMGYERFNSIVKIRTQKDE